MIADFYLPYRIGDGSVPVVVNRSAPASAPEPDPEPEPDPDPEPDDEKKVPYGGAAVRYRYPYWLQLPAEKGVEYHNVRIKVEELRLDLGDGDEIVLPDDTRSQLSAELTAIHSGQVTREDFSKRVGQVNKLLGGLGEKFGADLERLKGIQALELSVEPEKEFFHFLQFSHLGEQRSKQLTLHVVVTYEETAPGSKVNANWQRSIVYQPQQGQFTIDGDRFNPANPDQTRKISISSAGRATATLTKGRNWIAAKVAATNGKVWIDTPQVGMISPGKGERAFFDLGQAVPNLIATSGDAVTFEPLSKGQLRQGLALIVRDQDGAFSVSSESYTTN